MLLEETASDDEEDLTDDSESPDEDTVKAALATLESARKKKRKLEATLQDDRKEVDRLQATMDTVSCKMHA